MDAIAKNFGPNGVVKFERRGEWEILNGCIFFHVDTGIPNKPTAFAPEFINNQAIGNPQKMFRRLLCLGGVDVDIDDDDGDGWPSFGTRRELELDPISYTACDYHVNRSKGLW